MILTLDNLVKNLIGMQACANHPISVANPDKYFKIYDAKLEDGKIIVRGEDTIWFGEELVTIDMGNKYLLEPIKDTDGENKYFMIKLEGKPFRCECSCNVFSKPDKSRPDLYQCNSCEQWYEGD